MTCETAAPLLDRYLDGELPDAERALLEGHLLGCAGCAVEALRRRELQVALRAAGRAHEPDAPLRASLEARLRQGAAPPESAPLPRWLIPLAAILLIAVSLAALWVGTRGVFGKHFVLQAIDLHVSAFAKGSSLDVLSSDAQTVEPWFEGKIPFSFNLPDLTGTEWELTGGRLVQFEGIPAVQLVLKIHGHRVSVFVLRDPRGLVRIATDIGDRSRSRGFRLLSWTEYGLTCLAVSGTEARDLQKLKERFIRAARS